MKLIPALQFSSTNHSKQGSLTLERKAVGRIPFTCCDQCKNYQAALTENAIRAKMWYISVSVIKIQWSSILFSNMIIGQLIERNRNSLKKNILPISCAWDITFWSKRFIFNRVQIVKGRFIFWWLMSGS